MENKVTWVGSSTQEIYENLGPWQYHISLVSASKYHTVLYELPATPGQVPKPHQNKQNDWDSDHVRLPYSPKNLFPTKNVFSFQFSYRIFLILYYFLCVLGKR